MVSIKKITFNYLLPDIVEACSFIPEKYKSEDNLINKSLHKLSVPITLSAFILVASAPILSTGLFAGSMSLHLVGHAIEGFFSN
tara:strand:- start:11518 stop:11769 length:252 start_codon:yes stop_codon:yes gene_type:complete